MQYNNSPSDPPTEAAQQQLTCYLSTVALAWLHATAQIECSEHVAFGHQIQAWRDVLYSKRAIHVHVLPSWRSILSSCSWQDVRPQHDAGKMPEHWVAVGRPRVVKVRWEARVETPTLVELRHYAVTSSPIDVELPESDTRVNLQQLRLEWHI